jgi:iron complex transport system substrate-binding protein
LFRSTFGSVVKSVFMKSYSVLIVCLILVQLSTSCQNKKQSSNNVISKNEVRYAKGFSIQRYFGYSILRVQNPWPRATKSYTYILAEKNAKVPDSLKRYSTIAVPIKTIVVTSTTHIPSLEMLDVAQTLVGFPHTDYISSEKTRALIAAGKVKELGNNHDLNTELLLDLHPDVIVGYGIDNHNLTLDNLEKSGLPGDWNEETPLGKAEWIKFFGAFYGKQKEADSLFTAIEKDYLLTLEIAKRATTTPTILAGDMYEDHWYLPKGSSWGSILLKEAHGNYLWEDTKGTGSLSLSFETVFEKAKDADFWITSGQFSTLKEMIASNPHYAQFKAFQTKKVYAFSGRKGKTGGVLYYELAPNRPDLVLKDIVKLLHPDLLPDYKPYFFAPLK